MRRSPAHEDSSSTPADKRDYALDDFDYDLPPELIAQEPLPERSASRLMVLDRQSGAVSHSSFAKIVERLTPGDLIVVNDTRVIPARILARRCTGGLVELLLLHPLAAKAGSWLAMGSPLRKLRQGEWLEVESAAGPHRLEVSGFAAGPDGQRRIVVTLGSPADTFRLLNESGFAPLPPYIKRKDQEHRRQEDIERYQTVFAVAPGAVAAPTAGLHFSDRLLSDLKAAGVEVRTITLHVGPGTFKPIAAGIEEHTIEAERYCVPESTALAINKALSESRRVIAVGTTTCRALETAGASGRVQPIAEGETSLFIKPGHSFKVTSALLTNFHLPRSSLLLLVSAFAGHALVMSAYREAVEQRYRFFSYGDAMLIV